MKNNLSIVIPCYNEEENIIPTVDGITRVLKGFLEDYEIIIVNDNSTDKTGKVSEDLAKSDPRVRVFHNEVNKGLGYNYRKGIELAQKDYLILVPGDNEFKPESLTMICKYMGKAEIIIPFAENSEIRPKSRQIISTLFTRIVNLISGLKISYYNGSVLHTVKNLRSVSFKGDGFGYQAEVLVKLLRAGHSYYETPFLLNFSSKRMRVFALKNCFSVIGSLISLFFICKFGGAPWTDIAIADPNIESAEKNNPA